MNFFAGDKNTFRIFWGLAAVIFIVMLIITPDYGISGDDATQWRYGTSVWNYIKTFGEDKTAVTGKYLENTQTLYGGIIDGVAAMLIDIFKPENEFIVRHYWIMLFGFAGIVYTGLLARKLANSWLAGIIAMLFIVFTPRFFGEAFNNPKDIPFAATYIMALYYIIAWLQNLSAPKWKYTILLGVAIMLCLGIRIGGLLLIAYMGLGYLIALWQTKLYKDKVFKKTVIHGLVVLLIGYFGACIWWPYAWEDPFSHPYEAYKVMSDYPISLKMLFEGQETNSTSLPAYYAPKFILITLPLFGLIGLAGGLGLLALRHYRQKHQWLWLVIFAWAFPLAYIVYKHSVVYDGMRHTLFVLPPVIVTAALFFNYLLEKYRGKKAISIGIAVGLVILIALPAWYSIANHPNQYVYFNETIGGVKGAYGIYETDYYMNSVKQGYDWLNKNEFSKINTKDTVVLATNCIEPINQYIRNVKVPLKVVYVRYYQKNEHDWDYGIFYGRFLDREELQNGYFPSEAAIHNVTADGAPLTTVIKNDPERLGYKGAQAMKAGDTANAVRYLSAAAKKYPYDTELWINLALVHMNMNNLPAAKDAIEKARSISTLDLQTALIAGEIGIKAGDANYAMQVFGGLIENYPDMSNGYLGLAKVQAMQGSFDLAIENANRANELAASIGDGQSVRQGYMVLAFIYQNKGDMATAQKYYQAAQGQ
jgi:tetratricopeptide (TPR) repeat protein